MSQFHSATLYSAGNVELDKCYIVRIKKPIPLEGAYSSMLRSILHNFASHLIRVRDLKHIMLTFNRDLYRPALVWAPGDRPIRPPLKPALAKSKPFKPFMFTEELIQTISPITWWYSQSSHLDSKTMITLCRQILGGVASSAGIGRIFSTFGFVHSKVRNRLGIAKAGKLVFIHKLLNTHK